MRFRYGLSWRVALIVACMVVGQIQLSLAAAPTVYNFRLIQGQVRLPSAAVYAEIEFNFWLRSGGSGRNLAAVFQNELQYIGFGKFDFPALIANQVLSNTYFVIKQLYNR